MLALLSHPRLPERRGGAMFLSATRCPSPLRSRHVASPPSPLFPTPSPQAPGSKGSPSHSPHSGHRAHFRDSERGESPRQPHHKLPPASDDDSDNPWAHVGRAGGVGAGALGGPPRELDGAWDRHRDPGRGPASHVGHHGSRAASRYDGGLPDDVYGGPAVGMVPLGVASSVIERLRDDQEALRAQMLEQVGAPAKNLTATLPCFALGVCCPSSLLCRSTSCLAAHCSCPPVPPSPPPHTHTTTCTPASRA
jgi:hypothetical protein